MPSNDYSDLLLFKYISKRGEELYYIVFVAQTINTTLSESADTLCEQYHQHYNNKERYLQFN